MRSELRRRCEARLQALRLPEPFSVPGFCRGLAEQRGRPIKLSAVAMPPGLYGAWIAGSHTDHIFFERRTSAVHQEHIVLHEIGHLLCGHESAPAPADDMLSLLPSLRRETVRRVLGRTGYAAAEEREAELLASLISLAAVRAVRADPAGEPPASDVLRRLEQTLGRTS